MTIDQKAMGIKIQSETDRELTPEQIVKRMVYHDTAGSIKYLKDRKIYNAFGGAKFLHGVYTETVVKELCNGINT